MPYGTETNRTHDGPQRDGSLRLRTSSHEGPAAWEWRESDTESAVRFYGLRMPDAGMIKSGPQKIIAQGTDWRFLNELKEGVKGATRAQREVF